MIASCANKPYDEEGKGRKKISAVTINQKRIKPLYVITSFYPVWVAIEKIKDNFFKRYPWLCPIKISGIKHHLFNYAPVLPGLFA